MIKEFKLSEEHRRKISKALKGRIISWGNKISIANKGRKYTDEWKRNMSLAHKGKKYSEERKQKMSESIHIHHIDCTPINNIQKNLVTLTVSEHGLAHSSLNKLVKPLLERNIIKFNKELKIYELVN